VAVPLMYLVSKSFSCWFLSLIVVLLLNHMDHHHDITLYRWNKPSLLVGSKYLLNTYSVIWIVQHWFILPWLSWVSKCLSSSISSTFTQVLPSLSCEVSNGLFRNVNGILRCPTLWARCLINTAILFKEKYLVIRLLLQR